MKTYEVDYNTNITEIIKDASSEQIKEVNLICKDGTNIPELIQGVKVLSDTGSFSSLNICGCDEIPKIDANYIFLYLSNSDLSDEQFECIAAILRGNTKFTEFTFSSSQIKGAKARHLADALKGDTTLKKLCLIDNEIGGREIEVITDALEGNATLTTLNLQSNNIEDIGVLHLVNFLKKNTTLEELNLSYNRIENKGAMDIADILKKNNILMNLDLSYNGPGDQYYTDIADRQNWIGDQGTRCIADALKVNKGLVNLAFGSSLFGETTISDETGRYVLDCLKINNSLLHVELSKEPIYEKIENEVKRLCERNESRYSELVKFIKNNADNISTNTFDALIAPEERNKFTKGILCISLTKVSLSYLKTQCEPNLVDSFKYLVDADSFKIFGICKKFEDNHPLKAVPREVLAQITCDLLPITWGQVIKDDLTHEEPIELAGD
jgi:hypothetical protein